MSRLPPFIVGLTGGIGSGKTTVCTQFAELGVEVIDADQISRQVVQPGSPALQQLRDWFGADVLLPDGSLNRSWLRSLIFKDATARQRVESLLHPLIRHCILEHIHRSQSRWLILAAPLLLESNAYDFVDRILVVDVDEAMQISRTCSRDQCKEEQVRRIMALQLSRSERLQRADDVIHNDDDFGALRQQVRACFELYQRLADERHHAISAH